MGYERWVRIEAETLEGLEAKLEASLSALAAHAAGEAGRVRVLIYSPAADGWWRANGSGYTRDVADAGEFDITDAMNRIGSGRDWRSGQTPRDTPADCIVPASFRNKPTPSAVPPPVVKPDLTTPAAVPGGDEDALLDRVWDRAKNDLSGSKHQDCYLFARRVLTARDAAIRAECEGELAALRADNAALYSAKAKLIDTVTELEAKLAASGKGVDRELLIRETAIRLLACQVGYEGMEGMDVEDRVGCAMEVASALADCLIAAAREAKGT